MNDNLRLLDALVDPLLSPLDVLPSGAHVIDVACGSGNLDLELARRRPDLHITGIDIDPAVLPKSTENVTFCVMDMTALEFEDAVADAVISRFGLLNPTAPAFTHSAQETARVLAPGGVLSLVAWTNTSDSPYTRIGLEVLRRTPAPVQIPDLDSVFAESRRPGALEGHLETAGLNDIKASRLEWDMEFPSFEDWWQFNTGLDPLKTVFEALDKKQLDHARRTMMDDLVEYRSADGRYRLPASAHYITARRS